MNVAWFWVLGAMLTAYAVLDGYDLGAGALHLMVARDDEQRRIVLNAIGPVWNGNEVWLIAAGGMMVVSFPRLYAAAFSGFYLALMVVLWLLILRGVSIEFRSKFDNPLWRSLWDASFSVGSLLLAVLLGVALGNVIRGVPLGPDGYFQGTFAVMLNPYALLTGAVSLVVLAWHGSAYLRVKSEGELERRVAAVSSVLAWASAILAFLLTLATFAVSPTLAASYRNHPAAFAFPLLAALGLLGGILSRAPGREKRAYRSSTLAIVGLLGAAAMTVYPNLLISTVNPAYSLNIFNAASSHASQRDALIANLVGMVAVIVYSSYVHRTFQGKVHLGEHDY
ncbi:MAG: cytochrome d ubiquinol oxidase subunit II [Terriglobia bacterium]